MWIDGQEKPVGFSVLTPVHPKVVLLGGSAVGEAFRGRGIYQASIAVRLEYARALSAEAVLIQAVAETSAPIARRLGFRQLTEEPARFFLGNMSS